MSPIHTSALLVLLVLAVGCATRTTAEVGSSSQRNPSRIAREELVETNVQTLDEAIRVLRPNWLRGRGQNSFSAPQQAVVYVDDLRRGGPEYLSRINTADVLSVEFIGALTAQQRFGEDHTGGAVLVRTRR